MSRCRSCGARIQWALTQNGKRIPLDVMPTASGTFTLTIGDPPRCTYDPTFRGRRYTAHFATCPNADTHRRNPK